MKKYLISTVLKTVWSLVAFYRHCGSVDSRIGLAVRLLRPVKAWWKRKRSDVLRDVAREGSRTDAGCGDGGDARRTSGYDRKGSRRSEASGKTAEHIRKVSGSMNDV